MFPTSPDRVKHPSEILKKGQIVQAVILAIDVKGKSLVARHQAATAGCLGALFPDTSRG
jgi:transcriptional accessory protein Tex/SPT6